MNRLSRPVAYKPIGCKAPLEAALSLLLSPFLARAMKRMRIERSVLKLTVRTDPSTRTACS